jgi:hypothetical protein
MGNDHCRRSKLTTAQARGAGKKRRNGEGKEEVPVRAGVGKPGRCVLVVCRRFAPVSFFPVIDGLITVGFFSPSLRASAFTLVRLIPHESEQSRNDCGSANSDPGGEEAIGG